METTIARLERSDFLARKSIVGQYCPSNKGGADFVMIEAGGVSRGRPVQT